MWLFRIAVATLILFAVACDDGLGRDRGWQNSPSADRELTACISEAVRTSGGGLTRSEADRYCRRVFDCVWAEEESLAFVDLDTMYDCIEDVAGELGY